MRLETYLLKNRPWLGPQPHFTQGDVAGNFTITKYEGHSRVNPKTALRLSTEHHWYRCRCTCGTEEIHTQQQLIDKRRLRQCQSCTRKKHEDTSEPN